MRRYFDFLRSDDIPRMARSNYWIELRHLFGWGVLAGLIEGNTASIVVAKTFHGSPLLVTVVWTTPMLANLLSLLWGVVIRGRRRLRTFMVLMACTMFAVASVALIPNAWEPWGGWLFALQLALSRVFLAGLVTLRTSLWNANYPKTHRARITGRLQTLRFFTGLMSGALIGWLFDLNADYYRWVYPVIALIGLVSLWPLRRMRVRGEAYELARYREHVARRHAGLEDQRPGLWSGIKEALAVLKHNRAFARYCTAQYYLGSANFMIDPVLSIVITKQLGFGYLNAGILLDHLPNVLRLVTIRFWAPYFDRRGVLHFRVVNSAIWVGSFVCLTVAMFLLGTKLAFLWGPAIALMAFSRILNGIGSGGGAIAWNLGHLHFAGKSAHEADLYMGVHVALTGIRGLIMPFVGMWAYSLLGWGAFVIAIGLGFIALYLFRQLARDERRPAVSSQPVAEQRLAPSPAEAEAAESV